VVQLLGEGQSKVLWYKKRKTSTLLGIFSILIAADTLLAAYAKTPETSSYSPSLYLAVAFMVASALWYGLWGVAAAYIGCFLGAGIMHGVPLDINSYWSLADVWQSLMPLVAFRVFTANVGLSKRRDFLIYLVFGWLLSNLAGAIWGASMQAIGGYSSWSDFPRVFTNWLTGNLIIGILVTPWLLKYITPYLREAGVLVGWFHFKDS
jgi:hypothetical protein